MNKIKIYGISILMTLTLMLIFPLYTQTSAFHENLGIDDNKASELYRANPNDPAIVQWKSALQSAINDMGKCFTIQEAISCQSLISTIISNCNSHPNTLLACNDTRFAQFPLILKQAQEEQIKAEEEKKKAEEEQRKAEKVQAEEMAKTRSIQIQARGTDMLDKCFINSLNTTSKFEVADMICDIEMGSLQSECELANNTYNYCKDERFVGYLKQHNISNSTVSP